MLDKIFIFILLIIALVSNITKACEVVSPKTIIKINYIDPELFKFSNCSDDYKQQIISLLIDSNGVISSRQISSLLAKEIKLIPDMINIYDIKNIISNRLEMPFLSKIKSVDSLQKLNSIHSNDENIAISCLAEKCNEQKNSIRLSIGEETFLFDFTISKLSNVYVLLNDTDIHQSSLTPDLVSKKIKEINIKESYFSDIDNLKYFKPNKKINRDMPLLTTDLTPLKLAQPGSKVNVILKAKNITLKSSGVSRQSGHLNDYIEVYSPDTKKKYTGKLIDFNTIWVEI